jgi:hypothetical protein
LVRLGEIGDRKHALDARLELTGRNKSHDFRQCGRI